MGRISTREPWQEIVFCAAIKSISVFQEKKRSCANWYDQIGDEAEIVAIDDGTFPFTFSVRSSGDDIKALRLYARDGAAKRRVDKRDANANPRRYERVTNFYSRRLYLPLGQRVEEKMLSSSRPSFYC